MDYQLIRKAISSARQGDVRLGNLDKLGQFFQPIVTDQMNLLYLGSGDDIECILLITHGKHFTFVTDTKFDACASIVQKLKQYFPEQVVNQNKEKSYTYISLNSAKDGQVLIDIAFYNLDYVDFVQQAPIQYDFIYDKRSMIEGSEIKYPYEITPLLKTGGYWVGDYVEVFICAIEHSQFYRDYLEIVKLAPHFIYDGRSLNILHKTNHEPSLNEYLKSPIESYLLKGRMDYICGYLYAAERAHLENKQFLFSGYINALINTLCQFYDYALEIEHINDFEQFEQWFLSHFGEDLRKILRLIDLDTYTSDTVTYECLEWIKSLREN